MKPIAAIVLAAACSPAALHPPHPSTSHQLAELRSDHGACSDQWLDTTHIRACAQTGSPHTLSDSDLPFIVTTLHADTFPDADPGNWLVIVTGPDGKEILRGSPQHSVPEVGACGEYGCTKWNIASLVLPGPWRPGVYRIRYVCAFDTRRSTDLTITLAGSASATR